MLAPLSTLAPSLHLPPCLRLSPVCAFPRPRSVMNCRIFPDIVPKEPTYFLFNPRLAPLAAIFVVNATKNVGDAESCCLFVHNGQILKRNGRSITERTRRPRVCQRGLLRNPENTRSSRRSPPRRTRSHTAQPMPGSCPSQPNAHVPPVANHPRTDHVPHAARSPHRRPTPTEPPHSLTATARRTPPNARSPYPNRCSHTAKAQGRLRRSRLTPCPSRPR